MVQRRKDRARYGGAKGERVHPPGGGLQKEGEREREGQRRGWARVNSHIKRRSEIRMSLDRNVISSPLLRKSHGRSKLSQKTDVAMNLEDTITYSLFWKVRRAFPSFAIRT